VYVLCLDTATADVAAAVVRLGTAGPEPLAERVLRDARGAGEHLMPLVMESLAAADLELWQLGAVAVGLGPGPFTGLRAGVVTGAVLGRTLGVPAYGACSLDALAEPDVVVATDARRREVYWAGYGPDGRRVDGPDVLRPADLAAALGGRRVVGPGALLYREMFGAAAEKAADEPYPVANLAGLVAERALAGAPSEVLVPLYLRRPDATEPAAR